MAEESTARPGRRPRVRAGLPLRGFPLDLKRELAAVAERDGTNMNDVAVSILAGRLKVKYDRSMRPSTGLTESRYVTLEMPEMLRAKIKARAALQMVSSQAFVIRELREHLAGR